MLRLLTLLALCASITGCAAFNPYVTSYVPVTDRAQLPVESIVAPVEPGLVQGTDPLGDFETMLSEGYDLLGYSAFSGGTASQRQALAQGKAVGADVVVYYQPVYQRTSTSLVPFALPTQSTSYTNAYATASNNYGGSASASGSALTTTYGQQWVSIPVQQDTYFQTASYYVKTKSLVGMKFREPTPTEVKALGTQRLAVVALVIKGSEAYKADILPGDIVVKADGMSVDQIPDAEAYARGKVGHDVELLIVRDGKLIQKRLPIR